MKARWEPPLQQIPRPGAPRFEETLKQADDSLFVLALIWALQFMQGTDLWLHDELVKVRRG